MTTPDRPDFTVGNVAQITGQDLYSNAAAPAGTSTGKIQVPGSGRLYISLLYTRAESGSLVGNITVDQYAAGVLMSSRTLQVWDDFEYQTSGNAEVFVLPVEGQQVELTYGSDAHGGTWASDVTWSSAPLAAVETISNSGLFPGVLYVADSVSVAAGATLTARFSPVARAVSCSISGAAGKFNANLDVAGPAGETGSLGDVWGQTALSNTVVPFVAYAPLAPLLVSMHNTDTVAHTVDIAILDAS